MRSIVLRFAQVMVLSLLGTGASHATLFDRGGGLIYDDVLDITWLQDSQYSLTSGYSQYGRMTWQEAKDWAAQLEYVDTARGMVWTDWRLPKLIDPIDVPTYDLLGTASELSYLYYVELGLAPNLAHDRFAPAPTSSLYNPFLNLAYRGIWTETPTEWADQAWMFHFHFGSLERDGTGDQQRVWAVRDGDVAAVPEPGSMALLMTGLFGLVLAVRSRQLRVVSG